MALLLPIYKKNENFSDNKVNLK